MQKYLSNDKKQIDFTALYLWRRTILSQSLNNSHPRNNEAVNTKDVLVRGLPHNICVLAKVL
jgi:hypothetical protein